MAESETLKAVLEEFEGQTVGQAAFKLMNRYSRDEINYNAVEEFNEFIAAAGLDADDTVPGPTPEPEPVAVAAEVKPQPKIEKTSASLFVDDSDGDYVGVGSVKATCSTLLYLDDDGYLVFEDPDEHSMARVNIERLMETVTERRQQYVASLDAWENAPNAAV